MQEQGFHELCLPGCSCVLTPVSCWSVSGASTIFPNIYWNCFTFLSNLSLCGAMKCTVMDTVGHYCRYKFCTWMTEYSVSFNSSYHLCDYIIFRFWILWFLFKRVKHVCNHKLVMVTHDHKLVIQRLVISIDEAKQIRNGFTLANHSKHIKEPAGLSSIYQTSWWHSWRTNDTHGQ